MLDPENADVWLMAVFALQQQAMPNKRNTFRVTPSGVQPVQLSFNRKRFYPTDRIPEPLLTSNKTSRCFSEAAADMTAHASPANDRVVDLCNTATAVPANASVGSKHADAAAPDVDLTADMVEASAVAVTASVASADAPLDCNQNGHQALTC